LDERRGAVTDANDGYPNRTHERCSFLVNPRTGDGA
jgi:hypothetical protein